MKSKNFVTVTHLDKYPHFEIANYDYQGDYPIELKGKIKISFFPYPKQSGIAMIVDTKLARLLAKRINQHLDFLKGCK